MGERLHPCRPARATQGRFAELRHAHPPLGLSFVDRVFHPLTNKRRSRELESENTYPEMHA
jgi:hypothetical protein